MLLQSGFGRKISGWRQCGCLSILNPKIRFYLLLYCVKNVVVCFCRDEFIGLEISGGTIRGSVNKGAGIIGLQSTKTVNDGMWHKVR